MTEGTTITYPRPPLIPRLSYRGGLLPWNFIVHPSSVRSRAAQGLHMSQMLQSYVLSRPRSRIRQGHPNSLILRNPSKSCCWGKDSGRGLRGRSPRVLCALCDWVCISRVCTSVVDSSSTSRCKLAYQQLGNPSPQLKNCFPCRSANAVASRNVLEARLIRIRPRLPTWRVPAQP
jgi:hypothetical protein